jgi:hypothetical protein
MHTLIHVSYTCTNRAPPIFTECGYHRNKGFLDELVTFNYMYANLQSSDKGSYYNYLLLGILSIFFCIFFLYNYIPY